MPGNNPATHSCLIAAASPPLICAVTAEYTVSAASQQQNITPLAWRSFMPIGIGPKPGTTKSSAFGCQNGFLVAGAFVFGSGAWKNSPNLYFSQSSFFIAYPIAS